MKFAGRLVTVAVVLTLLFYCLILIAPRAETHLIAGLGTGLAALGWLFSEFEKWSEHRADRQWEELRKGVWHLESSRDSEDAEFRQEQKDWLWAEATTAIKANKATNASSAS